MKPILSIIIPHLNSGNELRECLTHLKNFEDERIEIVVMDGQSTDNSIFKLPNFNYELISEKDEGIYDAMNKGIKQSSAKFCYFMGVDDRFNESFEISKMLNILKDTDADVVYGNVNFNGNICHGEFDYHDLVKKTIPHQAMFFLKGSFELYSFFEKEYKSRGDYVLNIKWFCAPESKFHYIDAVIANYSDFGFSSSHIDLKFLDDAEEIFIINFQNYLSLSEIYRGMEWIANIDLKYGKIFRGFKRKYKASKSLWLSIKSFVSALLYRMKIS